MAKYIFFLNMKEVSSVVESKSGFLILKETPLPEDIVKLGSEGIVKRWRQAKLRGVALDKARELEEDC